MRLDLHGFSKIFSKYVSCPITIFPIIAAMVFASPVLPQDRIWDESTTPTIMSDPDTSAVELGVKFQSNIDGYITGLRFFKGPPNTGVHVGNLWTATGTLLVSVKPFS